VIDWDLVAKVAGGGFGVTILVLTILLLAAWLLGVIGQRLSTKGK